MVLAIFLAVVLGIASVAIYFYLGSLIHQRTVTGLQQAGASENILLVGSTTRCGLKHQDRHYGLCSLGVTGVNSDVTMIVHLDPNTGKVSLLSIPRDLFVPNARFEGANKIDAALSQGPSQLVSAIEEDFGIPINHFVELNFDSFASVVDAIGGVWMYFPRPVYDAESFLNIRSIGCHYLNGYHALQVVRARHLQIKPIGGSNNHATWPQEAQSDLARIRRTHEFLRVLAAAFAAKGIGNPSTDLNLATSVLPNLTVDQTFSENHMISLAETFATVSIGNVPQLTYPVLVDLMNGYQYKGGSYGDVAFPIQPGGFQTINQVFGTSTDQSTWDGHALPNPSSFSVAVLNGTGIAHQASVVADALRLRGYSISSTGDRTPVGPLAETIVWYGGPPPPKSGAWVNPSLDAAERVVEQLQGPVIMGYNPEAVTPGATVTIQTGSDLSMAPSDPTTTTTTTTTHPSPTTTRPSSTTQPATATTVPDVPGVATDNRFSAPSATAQPLEPWDPRGCNASHTGPA
jgi:LCP family protein required for cell wall assembly